MTQTITGEGAASAALSVLRNVRSLFADGEHFCQGAFAKALDNDLADWYVDGECDGVKPPYRFCTIGAIEFFAWAEVQDRKKAWAIIDDARDLLGRLVPGGGIMEWSDGAASHTEIVAVLDEVLA